MLNADKTKEQLLKDLEVMQRRISELETNVRQARSAFQKADERYRDLFESAADSIYIIALDTNRILDANANAARRLGYSHDELRQLSLGDVQVLPDEDRPDREVSWESTFSGARYYECYYRRKDGSLMPVEVSSSVTTMDRDHVIQLFVRDITKRRDIEAARQRAEQEREQLISDLNAFAHTVAHDLKSPLSVITGYVSMLEDSLGAFSEAEVRDMLKSIGQGSMKMSRIIDELLLFASTRQLSDVQVGALGSEAIVHEALARLRTLIEERQAEIVVLDANAWPVACGYAPWVEEVWANYISNAIKYGGSPPRVELGASLEPDDRVRFWVRDNGSGLSPAQQAQLFKMYSRLSDTRIEGHGLGLSIVQRIVEKLGGQVDVDSVVGQGSTFSFTLPLYKRE
jgi:PAS domain S-box-containing protein